jgi:hypothetical protein
MEGTPSGVCPSNSSNNPVVSNSNINKMVLCTIA